MTLLDQGVLEAQGEVGSLLSFILIIIANTIILLTTIFIINIIML